MRIQDDIRYYLNKEMKKAIAKIEQKITIDVLTEKARLLSMSNIKEKLQEIDKLASRPTKEGVRNIRAIVAQVLEENKELLEKLAEIDTLYETILENQRNFGVPSITVPDATPSAGSIEIIKYDIWDMLETLIHDYFVENTTDYPVILIPEDRKGEFLGMVAYKSKYGILAVHYVYNLPNILVAPERKLNDNG